MCRKIIRPESSFKNENFKLKYKSDSFFGCSTVSIFTQPIKNARRVAWTGLYARFTDFRLFVRSHRIVKSPVK